MQNHGFVCAKVIAPRFGFSVIRTDPPETEGDDDDDGDQTGSFDMSGRNSFTEEEIAETERELESRGEDPDPDDGLPTTMTSPQETTPRDPLTPRNPVQAGDLPSNQDRPEIKCSFKFFNQ